METNGKNRKIHSPAMKFCYRGQMTAILEELKDGRQVYTHHFEFMNPRINSFVGKDNRPHLRKCLWTLEADGLVENIDLGHKVHQWKVTGKGLEFLESLKQSQQPK